MSKDEIRELKHAEQGGMCPLCGCQIVKDPVELNKRTGEPLKSQRRLGGHWLMYVDRYKPQYEPDNVNLVHAPCGQSFTNWLDGTGKGNDYKEFLRLVETVNRPAIIMRDFVIRYLDEPARE